MTQYWVEVAYQCAKMEVQRIVRAENCDPRDQGATLELRIRGGGGRKERWRLDRFPVGRGSDAATFGREAREHYRRWRGFVAQ